MRHEITMPQLGMTQDSGVIVSWGKKPGDAVKADDILMEVETDKSTMEVEVGHDGILAELRAEPGAAVPVGDVVAVISDNPDDVVAGTVAGKSDAASASQEAAKAETPAPADEKPAPAAEKPAAPAKADRPAPAQPAPKPAAGGDGRILASPKAKLEAHRRGIDLARLAKQGVPQPFHVADLERLPPAAAASGAALSALAATAPREGFESFCDWAAGASEGTATRAAVLAAFASAAWRAGAAPEGDAPLVARVETLVPIPSATVFRDADGAGLGEVVPLDAEADADLVVLDLTGSGLSDYRSGGSAVPTFTIAESGDGLGVTLGFDEARLPVARAAAVLVALAGRLGEPLRHLL